MLSDISLLQGGVMKSHVHLNHFLERASVTVRFYFKTNRSKLKKTQERDGIELESQNMDKLCCFCLEGENPTINY